MTAAATITCIPLVHDYKYQYLDMIFFFRTKVDNYKFISYTMSSLPVITCGSTNAQVFNAVKPLYLPEFESMEENRTVPCLG